MSSDHLGKWVLHQQLGQGGMGRVYLGREEITGRQAAEAGMINRAVPAHELEDTVSALGEEIAKTPPEMLATLLLRTLLLSVALPLLFKSPPP